MTDRNPDPGTGQPAENAAEGEVDEQSLESVSGGVVDGGCIPQPLEPFFPPPIFDGRT